MFKLPRNSTTHNARHASTAPVPSAPSRPHATRWSASCQVPPAHRGIPVRRAGSRHRPGTVLLLVLVVVMILSLAGFSFTAYTYTEHKAARLNGDLLEAEQALESAEAYLLRLIELPEEQQAQLGSLENAPDRFRDISLADRSAETKVPGPHFTVLSPQLESGQLTGVRYGLLDASTKLHLGRVLEWERADPGVGKQALLQLPEVTETMADALLDWLDEDSQPRPLGAEAEYYGALETPYRPRNGIPQTLEELLLVRGMTRQALFGADENFNYQVDPYEERLVTARPAATPGGDQLPLSYYLTTFSAEGNHGADGLPRIWLNNPDLSQLHERLRGEVSEQMANLVVAYRQFGGSSPAGGGSGSGARSSSSDLAPNFRLPPQFPFLSPLDVVDLQVVGTDAQGRNTTWSSPYRSDAREASSWLDAWLDRVTVDASPRIVGRVNVNRAPREVLRGVPGLTESLVEQIVSMRESRTTSADGTGRHATWLWTEGLVTLDELKELLEHLTGRGDVWEAQVVGFWPEGGPAVRAFAVLDGTTRPARRLYWKDLRFYGMGYSLDVLTQESPENATGLP
jgi:hypothetical protein